MLSVFEHYKDGDEFGDKSHIPIFMYKWGFYTQVYDLLYSSFITINHTVVLRLSF